MPPHSNSILISELGWACFFSMAIAQVLKPLIAMILGRGFHPLLMFQNGGMPSSHTSLVTTLTLCVAWAEGTSSSVFAMCLIFSFYFVFEATGLRQEVGHQAKLLNDMFDELYQSHHVDRQRLRELVGHTWQEVLGGGVCGTLVFWFLRGWIFGS